MFSFKTAELIEISRGVENKVFAKVCLYCYLSSRLTIDTFHRKMEIPKTAESISSLQNYCAAATGPDDIIGCLYELEMCIICGFSAWVPFSYNMEKDRQFECDYCGKTCNGHPVLLYQNVKSSVFARICNTCVQEKEVTVKAFHSVTQIPATPESKICFTRLFPSGDGVLGFLFDFDRCKICGKHLFMKNEKSTHVSRVHGDGIGMFHCFTCFEVLAGDWMLPFHKCHGQLPKSALFRLTEAVESKYNSLAGKEPCDRMFRSLTTLLAITALLAAPICVLGDTGDSLPTEAPDTPTTTVQTTTPAATTTPATTTTSTTTTTTTTPKPTTTTAAPAPAPTTPAPAQIGNWNVTDKNNITCMMLQATIQISVAYTTADNKTAVANMTVPAVGSSASGSCENNETQSISISWTPADLEQTLSDKIDITFSLNVSTKAYHVSKLAVSVYPNPTDKKLVVLEVEDVELPPIPFGMSYRCSPAEKFNLTENSFLEVSDLQVQAFHTANDGKFGSASECQAGDTADIVPIVVGCALAGLVVIVLIAYLVGRRRSRQSGYLSM
ncbi:Hypothetical predicted protein [Cloeon dipterum]|uniref:Lysosome-associated membrane glycoprotein 5 n=1 Tax=Cloeon dipterum TaxID=197152 RepID=A0A8S1BXC1_9INSE|nr:Hypothetical predicted protein [Cloeon dipterum]